MKGAWRPANRNATPLPGVVASAGGCAVAARASRVTAGIPSPPICARHAYVHAHMGGGAEHSPHAQRMRTENFYIGMTGVPGVPVPRRRGGRPRVGILQRHRRHPYMGVPGALKAANSYVAAVPYMRQAAACAYII